ncbi:predicted protein, partial [Arabidopsis lyrata subsp. lyrata]
MGWIPCSGKSSGRTKTRRNADQKLNRKSSDCSVSTSAVSSCVYFEQDSESEECEETEEEFLESGKNYRRGSSKRQAKVRRVSPYFQESTVSKQPSQAPPRDLRQYFKVVVSSFCNQADSTEKVTSAMFPFLLIQPK